MVAVSTPAGTVTSMGRKVEKNRRAWVRRAVLTSGGLVVLAGVIAMVSADRGEGARRLTVDLSGNGQVESEWEAAQGRTFRPGEGLGEAEGSGALYRVDRVGTAQGVLERVAETFQVDAAVEADDDATSPVTHVLREVGGTVVAQLYWFGSGGWYFSAPSSYKMNLDKPDESMVRVEAHRIFAATGSQSSLDDVSIIEVPGERGGWIAYASMRAEGRDTPLEWSASWSRNGDLVYAQGLSVGLVSLGVLDTVSEVAAASRVGEKRWSALAPDGLYYRLRTEDRLGVREGGGSPAAEVTLLQAHTAWVVVWDKNDVEDSVGVAWLLPGAVLSGDDGSLHTVVTAADDKLVQLAKK